MTPFFRVLMASFSTENVFFLPLLRSASALAMTADEDPSGNVGRAGFASAPGLLDEPSLPPVFVGDDANRILRIFFEPDRFPTHCWPLVLVGPSAAGKTSLAHALVDRFAGCMCPDEMPARENRGSVDSSKPRFLTAEDFARGVLNAIDTNSVAAFLARFQECSAVGFDNLDDLGRYPSIQGDFVALLDRLIEHRIPVIVTFRDGSYDTADNGLSSPLRSRLSSGLTIDVAWPGFDARCHILKHLAARHDLVVDDALIGQWASQFPLSLPRLNQVIIDLKHREHSVGFCDSGATDTSVSSVNVDRLLVSAAGLIADHFSISSSALRGTSRKQSITTARFVFVYLMRSLFDLSYSSLGAYLSGRDHSTMIHAYRKITERVATDKAFAGVVGQLSGRLRELASMREVCS
jgi:chromosomal replication initiator protein